MNRVILLALMVAASFAACTTSFTSLLVDSSSTRIQLVGEGVALSTERKPGSELSVLITMQSDWPVSDLVTMTTDGGVSTVTIKSVPAAAAGSMYQSPGVVRAISFSLTLVLSIFCLKNAGAPIFFIPLVLFAALAYAQTSCSLVSAHIVLTLPPTFQCNTDFSSCSVSMTVAPISTTTAPTAPADTGVLQ